LKVQVKGKLIVLFDIPMPYILARFPQQKYDV
jgi:hypothetical protein